MAIIRASKAFEGSDLKPRANTYIKADTRTVSFGKDEKDGVYLFILGAYKEDSNGNGVWYRPLKIRDNFGSGIGSFSNWTSWYAPALVLRGACLANSPWSL